jgi:hypothetical protein
MPTFSSQRDKTSPTVGDDWSYSPEKVGGLKTTLLSEESWNVFTAPSLDIPGHFPRMPCQPGQRPATFSQTSSGSNSPPIYERISRFVEFVNSKRNALNDDQVRLLAAAVISIMLVGICLLIYLRWPADMSDKELLEFRGKQRQQQMENERREQ